MMKKRVVIWEGKIEKKRVVFWEGKIGGGEKRFVKNLENEEEVKMDDRDLRDGKKWKERKMGYRG